MPENSQQQGMKVPNGGQPGQNGEPGSGNPMGGEKPVYAMWYEDQPEEIRGMIDGEVSGLRNALQSERESRKQLERELRAMAGKAEKGSEGQAELTRMAEAMALADRRTEFYEAAHAAGVTNLRLAWLAAEAGEMFDRNGRVNLAALRSEYPELFRGEGKTTNPPGNAGSGTGGPQNSGRSMNNFIRTAAGKR